MLAADQRWINGACDMTHWAKGSAAAVRHFAHTLKLNEVRPTSTLPCWKQHKGGGETGHSAPSGLALDIQTRAVLTYVVCTCRLSSHAARAAGEE